MTTTSPVDCAENLADEKWIGRVKWTLWFCGFMYVLLGVVMGVLFGVGLFMDKSKDVAEAMMGVFMGAFVFLVSVLVGLLNMLGAWGLGQGKKWAWILSVILGAIYAPSVCLPFGLVILYGLLQDRVRKIYLP